eukprot:1317602-Rhodomonas_salina.4
MQQTGRKSSKTAVVHQKQEYLQCYPVHADSHALNPRTANDVGRLSRGWRSTVQLVRGGNSMVRKPRQRRCWQDRQRKVGSAGTVSYTHLRAHETEADL